MPVDKVYLSPSDDQIRKWEIQEIKAEIEGLEQACMRPFLAMHKLKEKGKEDSIEYQEEQKWLEKRQSEIEKKQAELRVLNDH